MKLFTRFVILSFALWVITIPIHAQNPEKYKGEVEGLTANDASVVRKNVILFTGSSSIKMWKDVQSYFPQHNILNRGFGGSQTSDLLFYFDKLILPYAPKKIFVYEGDNDINSGKTPEQILKTTDSLVTMIRLKISKKVRIYFITPKPSVARWSKKSIYEEYNQKLKAWSKTQLHVEVIDVWTPMLDQQGVVMQDLFLEDRLHMNKKGYDIWARTIAPFL
jgi:lysophospholipase L1-like esterase